MLKVQETFCLLLLVFVAYAAHPTFKIVDGRPGRDRVQPYPKRPRYEEDDDADSDLNRAEGPYRFGGGGSGSGAQFDRGLDPLAVRAARLHAYRAALLRSLRADEEFDNQHASRYAGGGDGVGDSAHGRRPPQRTRDAYEGGGRRPSTHGRGYRGNRGGKASSALVSSRDIDDDEEYY